MKTFIGISSVIHNDKLIALCSSNGNIIRNINGLSFDQSMQFFTELRAGKQTDEIFVCYAFSRDLEFLFSALPTATKDKLFQSYRIKKEIEDIEYEQEKLDNDFYHLDRNTQEFEQVDFERYVNQLALQEIIEVKYGGFDLSLQSGRILRIRKDKKEFALYDVYGFFRCSLNGALAKWQTV